MAVCVLVLVGSTSLQLQTALVRTRDVAPHDKQLMFSIMLGHSSIHVACQCLRG